MPSDAYAVRRLRRSLRWARSMLDGVVAATEADQELLAMVQAHIGAILAPKPRRPRHPRSPR